MFKYLITIAGLVVAMSAIAVGAGIGGNGTPGFNTSQPWTAFSPAPCPAATPLSVSADSSRLYVVCSDKVIYTYVK